MATIHFYGKPDCINNKKQISLLQSGGNTVLVHDLTTCSLTSDVLQQFFGDLPVVNWFNPTAPALKTGRIDPAQVDREDALQAMLQDRLLIRRPLMQIGMHRLCGFKTDEIDKILLAEDSATAVSPLVHEDIITCPNLHSTNCESKGYTHG